MDDFFTTKSRPKIKIADVHKSEVDEGAVRFVSEDLRPYSAIEGNGCKALMTAAFKLGQAYPNMSIEQFQEEIPGRKHVHQLVSKKSVDATAMISKKLHEAMDISGGFASTVDLWTDKFRQKSYMGITAHTNTLSATQIVADRFVIALFEVEEDSKTKEVVNRHMMSTFNEYGIDEERVRSCVEFVTDRGPQFLAMHDINRSNCRVHLLNNVVHEIAKEPKVQALIRDAAALVRYMKKGGFNYTEDLSLQSYCPTRFNTVCTMLRSVNDGYDTIYVILEKRKASGNPNHRNCMDRIECIKKSELREVIAFLEPFKVWTDRLEGDKMVTIADVWATHIQMNEHIADSDDDFIDLHNGGDGIVMSMKRIAREYVKRIDHDIRVTKNQRIAMVLNPQMKRLKRVDKTERDYIYNEINRMIAETMEPRQRRASRTSISSKCSLESFIDSDVDDDNDCNESSVYCTELTTYLNQIAPRNGDSKFDPREYWFNNQHVYPNLFKLFMRISCIPASSAPAERVFSTSGAVVTDRRSSLLPKSVGEIIVCRNLYQH